MITLTEQAARLLRETLRETPIGPSSGLRLSVERGEWRLDVADCKEDDRPIEIGEDATLFVSHLADANAPQAEIDVRGRGDGIDLVLRNAVPESAAEDVSPTVPKPITEDLTGPLDPGAPQFSPQHR